MPSCKMGQYQDAFAKALRTVDVHQRGNHMFGNPFKLGNSKVPAHVYLCLFGSLNLVNTFI